jgi:hypothetical protein
MDNLCSYFSEPLLRLLTYKQGLSQTGRLHVSLVTLILALAGLILVTEALC